MKTEPAQFWKTRLVVPAYGVSEAASYAHISPQTVAAWHRTKGVSAKSVLSKKQSGAGLSFLQLIELALVADMRKLGVRLADIDDARRYFKDTTSLEYPFAQLKFKTDGADILRDIEGPLGAILKDKLIAANHGGQYVWTEMLSSTFQEFNYDTSGAVVAWKVAGIDKEIEIDPKIAFGAPQIGGIKTGLLKLRWIAGEEADEIAEDFSLTIQQVIEAMIFEGLSDDPRLSRWIN